MIRIENLKIVNKNKTLISALNMQLGKAEIWAVVGKNGVGKTTFLHTLSGIIPYSQGSIEINKVELNKFDALNRAQNIALLPQIIEAGLNCTVYQAIGYGRYPWHKDPDENKNNQKMIEFAINAMELDHLKNNSIQQISGGELRRVEIATILAQNSKIMILDEPLNHLDIAFRYKLMQRLKELSENKTIIMATHDIQYVQKYCSHVMMIQENSKAISGKTKDIMTKDNLNKILGFYE